MRALSLRCASLEQRGAATQLTAHAQLRTRVNADAPKPPNLDNSGPEALR
jgi:hypothetical protein